MRLAKVDKNHMKGLILSGQMNKNWEISLRNRVLFLIKVMRN